MGTDGADDDTGDGAGARDAARPRSRPLEPRSQRERLLDGMARSVARHGYGATTVADVLREAGVSRRTFYERFADKEDCFLAAYDAIAERCVDRVATALEAAASWREGLERGVAELLALLAAEPEFARLGVVEVLAAGPRGLARREATLRRFIAFVEAGRDEAGTPEGPPPLVGQAIVGGVHELLYSRILAGEATRLPELADEVLHFSLMLLGMPRTAR